MRLWCVHVIAIVGLIVAVQTCSKKDDKKTATADPTATPEETATPTPTPTAKPSPLIGNWSSACLLDGGRDSNYKLDSFVFTASNVTNTNKMYTGSDCSTAQAMLIFRGVSTYTEGAISDAGTKIDFTVSKVYITVSNDAIITLFNTSPTFCGVTWTKDTEVDVTGKSCTLPGRGGGPIPTTAGKVSYDLYKITGTNLYFGNNSGDTDATRPTAVATIPSYAKQ